MRSWAVFDSPLQEALHTLKYRHNIAISYDIALAMTPFLRSLNWAVDVVVPVPLSSRRLRERGYNQIGKVAETLAYELGVEYMPTALRKVRETRSQVGLKIVERRENVTDAFQADGQVVNGRSILLMDDVSTTGATIRECANILLSSGAVDIYVFTIARALSHHDMNSV